MAITTYSQLKTSLQNWGIRSEATFTDRVDEFIDLAEDRIHYGSDDPEFPSEPLRIRGMETAADLTINAQTVAQPTGFLEVRRLYLNSDPKEDLDYLMPDRFWASADVATATTGKPKIFTIEGTNFVFGPSPDSTYTGKLLHWKKLDALSDAATTNWLITNAPGIYLYASMLEASIWMEDDGLAVKYARLYSSRINAMMRQDRASRYAGPLSARPDVVI